MNKEESNLFSKEGRLLQVEYAMKNTSKAGTSMGLICKDGIVLIGQSHSKIGPFREKIYEITDKVYMLLCGLFGDAMLLKKFAQINAIMNKHFIGEDPSVQGLCKLIGKKMQDFTQYVNTRPFGVSFLFAAYENGIYNLYSIDPSGSVNKWKAKTFGTSEDVINKEMEKTFCDYEGDLHNGTLELFKILFKVGEYSVTNFDKFEVLHFRFGKERYLTSDEIKMYLEEAENAIKNKS